MLETAHQLGTSPITMRLDAETDHPIISDESPNIQSTRL